MDNIEYVMAGFSDELEKIAGVGGVLGRFGQRQVHTLTGWTPKGGIQSIRGGAYDAAERLRAAQGAVTPGIGSRISNTTMIPGRMDKILHRSPEQVHTRNVAARHKELVSAREAHLSSQKAERMGLTSLPGYVKSLKTHGVGNTVSSGFKQQWDSMGPIGRSLMLGFPAVGVGGELARESGPGEAGRLSRAGSRLGDVAYMKGPVPMAGQIAAQVGVGKAGKHVGALFDRGQPKPKSTSAPAPATLEPGDVAVSPGDRIVSDRASGLGGGIQ